MSRLMTTPDDLMCYISQFVRGMNKLNLLSTCKTLRMLIPRMALSADIILVTTKSSYRFPIIWHGLTSIHIRNVDDKQILQTIVDYIYDMTTPSGRFNIRTLRISNGCCITPDAFDRIIERSNGLRELHVGDRVLFTAKHMTTIRNNCRHIRILDIPCMLYNEYLHAEFPTILANNRKLQRLTLYNITKILFSAL